MAPAGSYAMPDDGGAQATMDALLAQQQQQSSGGGGLDLRNALLGWGLEAIMGGLFKNGQTGSDKKATIKGQGGKVTVPAVTVGKPGSSGTGPGGLDFGQFEGSYGLPAGFLKRTAEIESAMNPNAKNPNSSASGLFQFINSTAKAYGLSNPFDPAASTDAASRLARDNSRILRNTLGRQPTAAELYLAHQQGGTGAARLLKDPNRPAVDVVGWDAVKLNGGSSSMTAGEFAGLWIDKFNRGF